MSSSTREVVDPVVRLVDDDREAVVGDRDLDVLDAVLDRCLVLLLLDRAGRVGDVGLADGEALEAAAGARDADGHADLRSRLRELLGHGLGDGIDGGRAVDLDRSGQLAQVLFAGVAHGAKQGECRERNEVLVVHGVISLFSSWCTEQNAIIVFRLRKDRSGVALRMSTPVAPGTDCRPVRGGWPACSDGPTLLRTDTDGSCGPAAWRSPPGVLRASEEQLELTADDDLAVLTRSVGQVADARRGPDR